jgi:hypothetical protein
MSGKVGGGEGTGADGGGAAGDFMVAAPGPAWPVSEVIEGGF